MYADDNVRKCMRVYMGQVNLYKIDENKRIGFLDQLREKLEKLNIEHEFSEPFNEDVQGKWAAVGKAYQDGIISLEQAVNMLAVADNRQEEIQRILNERQAVNNQKGE